MNRDQPTFSIVISTFNRAELVMRTVQAFLAQSGPSFEILVVNDGSSDDTMQRLRTFTDSRLRLVMQSNAGLAAARNHGFAKAIGQYVLFNDDDILPEQNFLQAHFNLHCHHAKTAVVSRIHIPPQLIQTPFMRFWEQRTENGVAGKPDEATLGWGGFWFATLSLERSLLPASPFANFAGYGWEEHELGWRLWQGGVRPRLAPAATASHEDVLTLETALKKWRSMGRTAWQFYKLHPNRHVALWTGTHPVSRLYKRMTYSHKKVTDLLSNREWENSTKAFQNYKYLLEAAYTEGLLGFTPPDQFESKYFRKT
ncbi:MAG: glycosyltransferase family 2 protein [Trueperaceae bacterium]